MLHQINHWGIPAPGMENSLIWTEMGWYGKYIWGPFPDSTTLLLMEPAGVSVSPREEQGRWWGMAGKCWALPSPGVHLPGTDPLTSWCFGRRQLKG